MWYVVWVTTAKEHQLKNHIERDLDKRLFQSIWLPTKIEKRKYKGVWITVEKLLFPGYLFINTDNIEEVVNELRGFNECIGILKVEDEYVPISKKEEEILHKLTGTNGKMDVSLGYIENGKVHIMSGPLLGLDDYIVSVDKHKRMVKVEMELFCDVKNFTAALELVDK